MSETEHYKGKLTPTGKTLIEFMEGEEFPDCYDRSNVGDVEECFREKFYKEYSLIDGVIYQIEQEDFDEYDDIMNAHKNHDGSIDFEVKYYNGGCSFDEAIECAVNKLK